MPDTKSNKIDLVQAESDLSGLEYFADRLVTWTDHLNRIDVEEFEEFGAWEIDRIHQAIRVVGREIYQLGKRLNIEGLGELAKWIAEPDGRQGRICNDIRSKLSIIRLERNEYSNESEQEDFAEYWKRKRGLGDLVASWATEAIDSVPAVWTHFKIGGKLRGWQWKDFHETTRLIAKASQIHSVNVDPFNRFVSSRDPALLMPSLHCLRDLRDTYLINKKGFSGPVDPSFIQRGEAEADDPHAPYLPASFYEPYHIDGEALRQAKKRGQIKVKKADPNNEKSRSFYSFPDSRAKWPDRLPITAISGISGV